MAVSKYRTKKGIRYRAEMYQDGVRIDSQAGFKSRLEAHTWEAERLVRNSNSMPKDLALYEAISLYLLDAEKRRKKNTVSYKKTVLRRFNEFIGKDILFDTIDRASVKSFLEYIEETFTPKTANKHQIELSALWAWGNTEGHVRGNPARQVEKFPTTKHVRYVPPKEHIAKALKDASQFEHDFIASLLHTAGRISELRELTWEDVDLVRGTVRLWTSKRKGGDKEPRLIALSPTLKEVFMRLEGQRVGGEVYVFTNPLTGTGYSRQSREVKYLFQSVCEKGEVPLFTAHCLRHFMATHFNDPRRAQKILGHANLKTTELYLHDLGVDIGAAAIFEAVTHEITHKNDFDEKEGHTVLQ